MKDSFVRTDPFSLIENVSLGYETAGPSLLHAPILTTAIGSTGIISTPRDLAAWGHWLNTQESARAPTASSIVEAMAQRSLLGDDRQVVSGNGQEFRDFRGVKTWSHGGTAGGFKSFLLRIPEQEIVIAVMGNRADFLKAAFAFELAEALLEGSLSPQPVPDMTPETIAELDSYAGDYQLFPGTVFSIRREGENLTFAGYGDNAGFALPRISKGVFLLNPARDIRLVFRDFAGGKATQMRWQVSEDGTLFAPRVTLQPLTKDPLDLARYTGTYYSSELMTGFEITTKDAKLWLATSLSAPVPLIPVQPGVFHPGGPVPFGRLEFATEQEGQIQTVKVGNPLVEAIAFERQD